MSRRTDSVIRGPRRVVQALGAFRAGEATRSPAGALVSNTGALLAGRVVVAALAWIGTLLIARSLSPTAWGQYSFVFSFLALLTIVTDSVNSRVAIRGLLDDPEPSRFAGTYILLRATLGLLGYAAAVAFVLLANYPSIVVLATAAAGAAIPVATISTGYDAVFQGRDRLGPVAMANLVGQTAQLGLTIALVTIHSSLVVLTVPATLAWVIGLAWKLGVLRPILRFRYVIVWSIWRALAKVALPLAIGSGLMTIYYNLDSVMLSKLDTFTAVGLYGIAYKFAGIVNYFSWALGLSLMGLMVKAWPDDPASFWRIFRRGAGLAVMAAVIIIVEFSLFAEPAIRLLYGSRFVSGAGAARIVMISECVGFSTTLAVTTLIALGKNRLYPIAGLIGVVVNFSLNLYFIPHYSFRGSAWATLITEVLVAGTLWLLVSRAQGEIHFPVTLTAKAIAGGLLAAGVAVVVDLIVSWVVAAGVSFIVYAAFLHLAKVPGPDGLPSLVRSEAAAT